MNQQRTTKQYYPPLPRRPIPLPWEDLASVISRTTRLMGYEWPGWILRPECSAYGIASKRLACLSRLTDYGLLEQLLTLRKEELYSLTLHRFAASVGEGNFTAELNLPIEKRPLEIALPKIARRHLFFSSLETQVCPLCLNEGVGFDRLYWRSLGLLICPRHLIYLLHECPCCSSPIPGLRLHSSLCPFCHTGDYRATVKPVFAEDGWLYDTQILLLKHLGVDQAEWSLTEPIKSHLRHLPSQKYFDLMHSFEDLFFHGSFQIMIAPGLSKAPDLQSLNSYPRKQRSMFLFHWIMANWPDHFFWLLEHMSSLLPNNRQRISRWIEGSRWVTTFSFWQEESFYQNPAFFNPDQRDTFALMQDFFLVYEDYFTSKFPNVRIYPWQKN